MRRAETEHPVVAVGRMARSHGFPEERSVAFDTPDDDLPPGEDTRSAGTEPVEPILQVLVHGFNMM